MACRSESESQGCCGGCGPRPFPWLSALRDPAFLRLWLRRYRRALALGSGAGAVSGLAVLALGDRVGALGPLLGGPWLRPQAALLLPASILAGLLLALGREGGSGRTALLLRPALLLAAAGLLQGGLEAGWGPGAGAAAVAFPLLGLPIPLLAARAFSSPSKG